MDKYQIASQEAWATFLRSRFEVCARVGFDEAAAKRAELADMELEVMEMRAVFARQQRNRVVGACRLPPEVLGAVFKLAQEDWSPELRSIDGNVVDGKVQDVRATYTLGWMCLLHVCSFWRQTALGSPALWSSISCMGVHPDSVPTLLARSRGLPLSLHIDGASLSLEDDDELQADFSGLWLCKPVLRRTKWLTLDNVPDHQLHPWLHGLRHPMPLLETFVINNPRRNEREIRASLPDTLFAQNAPNLHHVAVVATRLPNDWETTLFSRHLVHLSIEFDERTPSNLLLASAPSIQTFYATISSMRNLQSLTLRDVFPILPQQLGHTAGIDANLELPNLREIKLAASESFLEGCLDLIQRLSLADDTGVVLALDAEGAFDFDDRLPAPIIKVFRPAVAVPPFMLYISQFTVGLASAPHIAPALLQNPISEWAATDWKQDRLGPGARRLRICHWDDDYTVLPHIPLLSLRTVPTIVFASDFSDAENVMEPEGWINTFAAAREVQNIAVHYFDALVLLDALSEIDKSPSGSYLLFPRLSTIAMHAHMHPKYPAERLADMRATLDVLLLDVLQVRKEKEAPIKTLLVSRAFAHWDVWGRAEDLAHVEFF